MCPCGGELTVWCFEHGDWVCDDCGCRECEADAMQALEDELEELEHQRRHPVWNEGCSDCVARADQREAEWREA